MTILPEYWEALDLAEGKEASASNIERVSKTTSKAAASWAFTQWDLRKRAKTKFEIAYEMLFIREALEQSTSEAVGRYHASQFPEGALVADLTCGIGGDLISLARRGPVVGYETDPERAAYARHNLKVYGLDVEIREYSCLEGDWDFEFAVADPARRVGGRRTNNPDDFSPNPVEISERMSRLKRGLIKLSPMLRDDFLESLGEIVEFVSFGGECREALVWVGTDLSTSLQPGVMNSENAPGMARFATHLESAERLAASELAPPSTDIPMAYLYEADPAAIRAHCLNTLCEQYDLTDFAETNGYLTGDSRAESPWLRGWAIESEPMNDLRQVKSLLVSLESGTPVVKVRGVDVDPSEVQRKLRLYGKLPYTVFVYAKGKKIRYVVGNVLNRPEIHE